MCRLIESIRLSHRTLHNLPYHEARMNRARAALFGCTAPIDLSSQIRVPPLLGDSVYKCRILYKEQIEHIEFIPYQQKTIRSLQLVYSDTIDYDYKFENREMISALFTQRGKCDDILIVKNGHITDTSYSNITFFDGKQWITPSTPLLGGTQRQKLIDEKLIYEQKVLVGDLYKFISAKPINALLGFEGSIVPITQIKK